MKGLNVYLNENQNDCKVYFGDWVDSEFIYEYKSNGNNVKLVVDIVDVNGDGGFTVNGKSIGLEYDDFRGCEDIDDCGIVLGKHLIQDNDSEVMMTVIPSSRNKSPYTIHLTKDLGYKTDMDEDWTLSIRTVLDRPLVRYEYFELNGNDVMEIVSMISKKQFDGLNKYVWEKDPFETLEFMNLWGDELEERLSFEILDENNNNVINGEFIIPESNVIYYDEYYKDRKGKTFVRPEYVLMKTDVVKRGWCSFSVPRKFDITGVHFIGQYHFDDQIPNSPEIGDTVTSIHCFRYNGKFYSMSEGSDSGTLGDIHYSLLKWDENYNWYDVVCRY